MSETRRAFRYFVRFAWRYKSRFIAFFVTVALYAGCKTFPIYLIKNFFSFVFQDPRRNFEVILWISGTFAACGIGLGIFSYVHRYLGHYLSIRIGIDIKNKIYNHFTELPLSFFDKQEKGDLITKMTHDVGSVGSALKRTFVSFLRNPFEFIWLVTICFVLCWQLALLFFALIPLLVLLVRNLGRKISKRSKLAKEILSASTVTMDQFFSAIKLIKSFHSLTREEEKFRNVNRAYFKAHMSTSRVKARSLAYVELLGSIGMAILLPLGAYLVGWKYFDLKPEEFIVFFMAFYAAVNSSRMIGHHWVGIMREAPSFERLYSVLQTESDITVAFGAVEIEDIEPGIEFKDVYFAYGDDDIIRGISLHVKPGEMVAFVGPSGGGKTTLLDLVPRFYEVDRGGIRIGGKDIRDVRPDSLMAKIGIVLQDSLIFNSSALENIRYGNPDATEAEVKEAARRANIHDDLEKLPEGYDTFLGEEGIMLSGGQKQRVSIARSLLKGAPILIMDEPTSELDSQSEKLIIDTLEDIRNDRILLIIAHRLSTVLHADRIVVIKGGRIEAVGPHDELLKKSPTYKRMYEIQFSDTEY